jgi:hypothetical protein
MAEITVASTHLDIIEDRLVATEGMPFEPEAYSRMKYGSQLHARNLGVQLGQDIIEQASSVVDNERPLRALVIYKHVPSAATTVTQGVLAVINQRRIAGGLEPAHNVHVRTGRVLGRDYSSLDEAGRAQYIADTGYALHPEDVKDSNVIVVDDIRVTGSAEDLAKRLLEPTDAQDLVLAYSSILNVTSARRNPALERAVNTSSVAGLDDLYDIVQHDGMTLTVRTLKMVLGEENHEKLALFLEKIPTQLLFDMYAGALGSGPEFTQHYSRGFAVLQNAFSARQ